MILSFDPVSQELIGQSEDGSSLFTIHIERFIVRLLADCGVLSVELADDAIDVFFTPIEDMPASVSIREMGAGHWRLSLLA
jgi:hypothetical protein